MKLNKTQTKLISTTLVILLIFVFFGQDAAQKKLAEVLGINITEEVNNTGVYNVTDVIDGDTIKLEDGRRVRYLNIDTAESVKPNTPVQCFSKEASEMNKALVEGKNIIMTSDEVETDRYGRDLRFIFLQGADTNDIGQSINAKLVQMGYARAYIIKPNDTFEDEFRQWQKEAQDKNIGIWKSCPHPFEE